MLLAAFYFTHEDPTQQVIYRSNLGRMQCVRRYPQRRKMHYPAACASCTMHNVTEQLRNVTEALRGVAER